MTKIYIAGPMTGLPELNYPAFHAAAAELRAQGHQVENPAENPAPACGSWNGYMRLAIAQLTSCEAIYLLPGWAKSKGARLERLIAQEFGLQRMYHADEWADIQAINTACEQAAAQGMRVAMLDDGPVFFSMEGDHQAASYDHLNCPACGGSGHVGDLKAEVQAEPVAWLYDGTLRSGSTTTSHRVITTEAKNCMPKKLVAEYSTPLYTSPQATQQDAQEGESAYQRGYRHGYNRRDAEVQGALL